MAAIPVRELITIWGFKIDDKPLKQMETGVKNIKSSLALVGGIAAAAAGTLFGIAKSVANTGEEFSKMAAQTGVGVEALQELTFAADQAGVAQSDLASVLTDLSNRSFSVIEGNQQQALAFRRLGVQVANSAGDLRDADEVLLDLADSFARLPDGAEKTVLATQALGGAGAKLIPFLNKGSAGIKEMRLEAQRLGIVLGKDTVDASVKFNQSLKKALGALTGIKNTVGAELLPVIQELLDEFTRFITLNRRLIAQKVRQFIEFLKIALENMFFIIKNVVAVVTSLVSAVGGAEKAFKLFGVVIAIFLGLKLLAGIGAITLGVINMAKAFNVAKLAAKGFNLSALFIPIVIGVIIAAIALLIEDFIAFSEGRDSVLGRTIKVLKEDFPKAFETLKNVFELMRAIVNNQIAAWKNLFDFIIFGFNKVVDFFKNTILPFFQDSFIGTIFEKLGSFFTSAGFNNAIKAATIATEASTAVTQGAAPPTVVPGGGTTVARSVIQTNEFNINADTLTKEEAVKAIESGVAKSMDTTLRETERDVSPAVER